MNKTMIGIFGLFLFAATPVFRGTSTEFPDSQLQVKHYNGIPLSAVASEWKNAISFELSATAIT